MTLPESLARKALPCRCRVGQDGWPSGHSLSCAANHRPAVEAVLREMVEVCAEIADENPFNGYGDKYIASGIRALLTEELPND